VTLFDSLKLLDLWNTQAMVLRSGTISQIIALVAGEESLSIDVEPTLGSFAYLQAGYRALPFIQRMLNSAVNKLGIGGYSFIWHPKNRGILCGTPDYIGQTTWNFSESDTNLKAFAFDYLAQDAQERIIQSVVCDPTNGTVQQFNAQDSQADKFASWLPAPSQAETVFTHMDPVSGAGGSIAQMQSSYAGKRIALSKATMTVSQAPFGWPSDLAAVSLQSKNPFSGLWQIVSLTHAFTPGRVRSTYGLSRGELNTGSGAQGQLVAITN
jgi:hypothetical protein